MPAAVAETPLTDAQRAMVEEYAAQWDALAVLRKAYPDIWRKGRVNGLDDDDIRSAAWAGVVRASQTFDPTVGAPFYSYALHWIRASVGHAAEKNRFTKHSATNRTRVFSGDAPAAGDGDRVMWDVMGEAADATDPAGDPIEFDRLSAIRARLDDAMRFLQPRLRLVLELRHGLDRGGEGGRTLEEVAGVMGVTRERVRQLEARAMNRIRVPLQLSCTDLIGGVAMDDNRGGSVQTGEMHERNGTAVPAADLGNCPDCKRPYAGKIRRCFVCKPTYRNIQKSQKPAASKPVAPRPTVPPTGLRAELDAMAAIADRLDALDAAARGRVLRWLASACPAEG